MVRVARRTKHDLNNLLMVVAGCLEIALSRIDADPAKAKKMMERAQQGATAIESYAAKLPTLAGRPTKQPSRLPLHATLPAALETVRDGLPEGITLVGETATDSGVVDLPMDRLHQIVGALVKNAVEALPNGGEVLVRSRNVAVGPRPERSDLKPGLYAVLEIQDHGIGMDAETREHLFEPFFSTKKGEERGLGLATVYGIARQANGAVWIESEKDVGTLVQVHLPLSDAPQNAPTRDEEKVKTSRPPSNEDGAPTVLLVDDDATVREIVHDVLTDAGYAVIVAAAGPEALALARGYDGPIDLLLTDVIMPGMDGAEVAARFRELRPRSRVLFMSGYAEDVLRSVGNGALSPFLPKPFPPDTLRRKLVEVLGAA